MIGRLAASAVVLALGACASSPSGPVTLSYAPPASVTPAQGKAVVAVGQVTDVRGNDPNWYGAVRGGYGNPLKVLTADKPVKDVVADAMAEGMKVRGLSANGAGAYRLDITLRRLDANQVARREAHVDMTASLVNVATGATAFTRDVKADKVTGTVLAMDTGVFSDPDILRALANDVLRSAIDQLLDDPAFRAALG